jgi:hypothetical protein
MALFFECMLLCAQNVFDIADIVREAMLRTITLISYARVSPLLMQPSS